MGQPRKGNATMPAQENRRSMTLKELATVIVEGWAKGEPERPSQFTKQASCVPGPAIDEAIRDERHQCARVVGKHILTGHEALRHEIATAIRLRRGQGLSETKKPPLAYMGPRASGPQVHVSAMRWSSLRCGLIPL